MEEEALLSYLRLHRSFKISQQIMRGTALVNSPTREYLYLLLQIFISLALMLSFGKSENQKIHAMPYRIS